MGTAIKHSVPDQVKPSFESFDIWALTLRADCQSAQMSKIRNDGLTRSGKGCFIAVRCPYGNSGRQRVEWSKVKFSSGLKTRKLCYSKDDRASRAMRAI